MPASALDAGAPPLSQHPPASFFVDDAASGGGAGGGITPGHDAAGPVAPNCCWSAGHCGSHCVAEVVPAGQERVPASSTKRNSFFMPTGLGPLPTAM